MSDKVRELAEKLAAPKTLLETNERILRAALEPLLDAAAAAIPGEIGLECGAFTDGPTLRRLAAELQDWQP